MRISLDESFMTTAFVLSMRSTCQRRRVGCVLIDEHKHIIATGYNGVPSGAPHCIDGGCAGVGLNSGDGLDRCESIHAEQNALLQCSNVMNIHTVYTTTFPCMHCFKMIANTGCKRLVYYEDYPASRAVVEALNMRLRAAIIIVPYTPSKEVLNYAASPAVSVLSSIDLASTVSSIASRSAQ
jgi:dCMP deaminase